MSTLDFVEAIGGDEVPQWRRRLGIGGLDFMYNDDFDGLTGGFTGGSIEVEPKPKSRVARGVAAEVRPAPTGQRKTDRHEYIARLREVFAGAAESSDSDSDASDNDKDDLSRQTKNFEIRPESPKSPMSPIVEIVETPMKPAVNPVAEPTADLDSDGEFSFADFVESSEA